MWLCAVVLFTLTTVFSVVNGRIIYPQPKRELYYKNYSSIQKPNCVFMPPHGLFFSVRDDKDEWERMEVFANVEKQVNFDMQCRIRGEMKREVLTNPDEGHWVYYDRELDVERFQWIYFRVDAMPKVGKNISTHGMVLTERG